MATCANCSNDAVYTYQPGPEFSIHYCPYHLPKFLTRTENPAVVLYKEEEVKVTETKTSKKKSSEAVAEESN
jgi:hypothetical protein